MQMQILLFKYPHFADASADIANNHANIHIYTPTYNVDRSNLN
jgi:hypothetical protein